MIAVESKTMEHDRRRRAGFAALVLAALVFATGSAAPARAQDAEPSTGFRPRPVRVGTVSLHGAVQYGKLLGGGRFAEVFDTGVGAGFGLRYRTERAAAFGLGFESHQFDAKSGPDSTTAPARLQIIVTTLDYYRYANTRGRTPRYLVVGAGIAQTRQTDADDEREFPGDGGVFKIGGGVEYWLSRTLTAEVGVRYYGVFSRSELNHDVQASLGVAFYTTP